MPQLYHILPIYKSFPWGGRKLIEFFRLDPSLCSIGTVYHVIALPGDLDNTVLETGEPLSAFYETHRDLFSCNRDRLPVRMTTTCNEGRQSYQLHPTDAYALAHEGTLGKVSGSVTIEETDEVRSRLFGNTCKTLDAFKALVAAKDWDALFSRLDVKTGDFLHTPAGVIHGGEGDGRITCTFSTNGDITYRFYDFEKNDPNRPLHLENVYDCVNIPEVPLCPVHVEPRMQDGILLYDYYAVPGEYVAKRMKVESRGCYCYSGFLFLACIEGMGSISGSGIRAGETIFVPANFGTLDFKGKMDLIAISYIDE